MVGDFEWVTLGDHLEAHTILTDLTQQSGKLTLVLSEYLSDNFVLGNLLPGLSHEVEYALKTEFPDCKGHVHAQMWSYFITHI